MPAKVRSGSKTRTPRRSEPKTRSNFVDDAPSDDAPSPTEDDSSPPLPSPQLQGACVDTQIAAAADEPPRDDDQAIGGASTEDDDGLDRGDEPDADDDVREAQLAARLDLWHERRAQVDLDAQANTICQVLVERQRLYEELCAECEFHRQEALKRRRDWLRHVSAQYSQSTVDDAGQRYDVRPTSTFAVNLCQLLSESQETEDQEPCLRWDEKQKSITITSVEWIRQGKLELGPQRTKIKSIDSFRRLLNEHGFVSLRNRDVYCYSPEKKVRCKVFSTESEVDFEVLTLADIAYVPSYSRRRGPRQREVVVDAGFWREGEEDGRTTRPSWQSAYACPEGSPLTFDDAAAAARHGEDREEGSQPLDGSPRPEPGSIDPAAPFDGYLATENLTPVQKWLLLNWECPRGRSVRSPSFSGSSFGPTPRNPAAQIARSRRGCGSAVDGLTAGATGQRSTVHGLSSYGLSSYGSTVDGPTAYGSTAYDSSS